MEDNSIEIQRRSSVTPRKEILTPSFSMDEDVRLLDDEKFDFDLAVSPAVSSLTNNISPKSEASDEEIFIGSVGLREACAAKIVEEAEKEAEELKPMSPLTAHQMVELFMEAQKVAIQIKATSKDSPSGPSPRRCSPRLSKTKQKVSPQKTLRLAAASGSFKKKHASGNSRLAPVANSNKKQENVYITPQIKSLKPFSLDFKSPVEDEIEIKLENSDEKVNVGTERGVKTSLLDSGKDWKPIENKSSGLKRSRSLRAPTIRRPGSLGITQPSTGLPTVTGGIKRSNSICSPQSGSLLKRPIIAKRKSDPPESSFNSSMCSNTSDKGKSKLAVPQIRGIPRRGSVLGASKSPIKNLTRKSPRLPKQSLCVTNTSSGQRSGLKSPQQTLGGGKPNSFNSQKVPSEKKTSLLKGPLKKLELLKPGSLQRKILAVKSNIAKPGTFGPLKATAPAKSESCKTINTTKSVRSPLRKRPLNSSGNNVSTPVKRDKVMAPKKLMREDAVFTTPKKSAPSVGSMGTPNSVSMSARRRSFLPTPGRMSSASSCNSSLFRGSLTSTGSMESSPKLPKRPQSPAVGRSNAARVLNTPMVEKKDSTGWTPVRRKAPPAGDEHFVCTKWANKQ